ncbi:MAG: polysaccharide deacetylase family protein [Thermomicrobiales bacterium]|nr:polysaccharide deacetylase family protein [Thermomicrobiales bacterium]
MGWRSTLVTLALLVPLLVACGGDDGGDAISWQPGLPAATMPSSSGEEPTATTAPNEEGEAAPTESGEESPAEPTETTAAQVTPPDAGPTGRLLTDEELAQYQPNELGKILVIEYHQFTNDPSEVAQFTRTYDSFRADLQWLYENGYYVVSMREVIENRITAPAGKKPFVMTFDDSPVNQFRFLVGGDGSLTVDPGSAVGIMEEFFAAHPDFGRGGMFGVLPNACFDTGVGGNESDQAQYCAQKISFLIDNGYEVENHTLTHSGIYDVEDDFFLEEIGGAIEALREYDSRVEATIFVVPFGMYPALETRQQQREWMRNGFEWNGTQYKLIGSLMVGSEPAFSPASDEWDSMWIYRIQMCDCSDVGGFGWDDYWQSVVTNDPGMIYVSDGNPDTITVPENAATGLLGNISEDTASTHEIIRY